MPVTCSHCPQCTAAWCRTAQRAPVSTPHPSHAIQLYARLQCEHSQGSSFTRNLCTPKIYKKKQVKWVSCIGSVLWRLHCPTKSRAGTAPERHVPSASPSLLAYSTPALPPPNVPPSEANDQGKPAHNWLSLFRLAFHVEQNANKLVQAN